MKTIVLGGDGFCGWATSLYLSKNGYDVVIVDNLSRREIEKELDAYSLTPISSIETRLEAWEELSGKKIKFYNINIAEDYDAFLSMIQEEKPDSIVHFAEQRAAPYSMKSSKHKRYTVNNNLNATNNVLCSIVDSGLDIHLVHLGTAGVYGYGTAGIPIPEGYLDVEIVAENNERIKQQILYPVNPGSVYHMTKCQDQLLFFYYNKNDKLKITDLHQGIVWGTFTDETSMDERLINRFDYDGDYGTVLNRFLIQAAAKHPLTVHGTGGQTRAFIHIRDTVQCVKLALENENSTTDRVNILNQLTETHRIRDLAQMISDMTGVPIANTDNPRNEADENELKMSNACLLDLGLKPTKLSEGLLKDIEDVAEKYIDRCDLSKIPCVSTWTKSQKPGRPSEVASS